MLRFFDAVVLVVLSLPRLAQSDKNTASPADATDDVAQDWLADTAYEDTLDEFAYGGDGMDLFDNNYYGDEMLEYYDHAGTYSDPFGEDYFFDDVVAAPSECTETDAGEANLTAQACDVAISGVDELADKLEGGVDGTYALSGCYDGWPKYVRKDKKGTGARTLYFSTFFRDWDICEGLEVNATKLLVFGGDTMPYSRPNFVPKDKWHLNSNFMSSQAGAEPLTTFPSINMTIECANGKALKAPAPPTTPTQPLLTDDEADAKYRDAYSRARVRAPPTINFFMIMTVLLAGMGVVMGLPYLLFKKKDAAGKSWAQQLEDSRKRRAGHVQ